MDKIYDNFLQSNCENDIYIYTKDYAFVSKGYKLPEGDEFKIFSPIGYRTQHCRNLGMNLSGSELRCVENDNLSLTDFYTYKTDYKSYFVFVGESNYIVLTTDKVFNYIGLEVEDILHLFVSKEDRKLYRRIEELEDTVSELKKRIVALENNSIFVPQTCPPQITRPLEWSCKERPWIRNSNRSDG